MRGSDSNYKPSTRLSHNVLFILTPPPSILKVKYTKVNFSELSIINKKEIPQLVANSLPPLPPTQTILGSIVALRGRGGI